jgi:hypothetical protein
MFCHCSVFLYETNDRDTTNLSNVRRIKEMRICIPDLSGGRALQLSVLLVLQGSAAQRK